MNKSLDLVSFGESMVELFAEEPIATTPIFHKAYGGDAMNVLVAASRLGSRCGFISNVGNDPFAPYLLSEWRSEGIDVSHATIVEGFNAVYFITVLAGGQREFTYYRAGSAASRYPVSALPEGFIARAKAFYTSGITQAISSSCRETALRACQVAKQHDILVAFDANLRLKLWSLPEAREALAEILKHVDVALISHPEETGSLIDCETPEDAIRYFQSRAIKIACIKMGEHGCQIGFDGGQQTIPALQVNVVDTTGAGDAFNGAFLHALTRGWDVNAAGRLGVAHAGLKCRGRGAVASLPQRDETYAAAGINPADMRTNS